MRSRILLGIVSVAFAAAASAQVAVVSAASFRANQPLAAGSIAAAFGTFTGVTATSASAIPLPTSLAGVSVFIDTTPAPLFYVSDSQINLQIPGSLGPGTHQIRVVAGSGEQTGSLVIMDAAPGIFTVANTGSPLRAAAQNENLTTNAADSPESRGHYIILYATGPGALTQAVDDGTAAPVNPYASTVSTPRVYIAGVEATDIQFTGLTPTLVALWQINVRIPDMPFIAGRVPVRVFMNGVDSNEVSIFVAQ
jgi:uncharacterized protein (TIGR03437 family)